MRYATSTDLSGDMSLAEAEQYISEAGGNIQSISRDGNGNYDTTISFPDSEAAYSFLAMHEDCNADEVADRVYPDFGPGAFNMNTWQPVQPASILETLVNVMEAENNGGYVKVMKADNKVVLVTDMQYGDEGDDGVTPGPFAVLFRSGDKVLAFEPRTGHPAY